MGSVRGEESSFRLWFLLLMQTMKASKSNGMIVGGMRSSDGKTVVTCALLAALAERGLPVQPFKVGPDFIDPGYHEKACGITSRNLDAWMMGESGVLLEVQRHGAAKFSIVEGVMGLFDGSEIRSDEGSTMALARLLNWPVLLVLPSAKAGRSVAAALRGFVTEAGRDRIAGVILNGVASQTHAEYLREVIAPLKLPVYGAIPVCKELSWPERYLGLQASQENPVPNRNDLARLAEKFMDVSALLDLMSPAPSVPGDQVGSEPRVRIALARDEAFHFYYQANLDYLRNAGAELIEFSPVHDTQLPPGIDGLVIGGGFPELFSEELSQNAAMRSEIRVAIGAGMNCYAECGGLILLSQELIVKGKRFPMAKAIPGQVEMTQTHQHFGYCECLDYAPSPAASFRGHEFHHSRWLGEGEFANLWTVRRKRTKAKRTEGFRSGGLHASYVHLYFSESEAVIAPLVRKCQETKGL
jgi:cobyrinic acid a,c-diamide synthase